MRLMKIGDRYNPHKVWHIKKTKCGHVYLNQSIKGKKMYSAYQRTTNKHLNQLMKKGR